MLNSDAVTETFADCLYRSEELSGEQPPEGHVRAEGIIHIVGFHPDRLESHRSEIEAMLAELPDGFRKSGGGGWSFLNACMDRDGNQWTGMHLVMEQLVLLGMAIGKVSWQLPRDLWSALPGGMPYFIIDQ